MGASAGRVLLIPKGDWNAETTYTGLDWVRHNGAAWVCKNTCTNVEPTEANSDNWQIIARDGQSGSVINVDATMSDTSENPVQNKVIKKYVDEHTTDVADMTGATADQNGTHGLVPAPQIGDEKKALLGNGTWGSIDAIIDVDTVMSDKSENPVQNKVIKKYVDDKQVNIDGITITLDEARNVIKLADALKDKIGTALQPESIVNNQTTTEEGFALDARQANPNVSGSLGAKIQHVRNYAVKASVIDIFNKNSLQVTGSDNKIVSATASWMSDQLYVSIPSVPSGKTTISINLSMPANSYVILNAYGTNGQNIVYDSGCIFSNNTGNSKNEYFPFHISENRTGYHAILIKVLVISGIQ